MRADLEGCFRCSEMSGRLRDSLFGSGKEGGYSSSGGRVFTFVGD